MRTEVAIVGSMGCRDPSRVFYLNGDIGFAQLLGILYVQALECKDHERVEASIGGHKGTAKKEGDGVLITVTDPEV